ncbi:Hypothetical protein CINCED_3A001428 [Cinara cedri]|uniref:Uncharacterized protein n=1 Tax=Cinara cedri TaxID=506608 RepID=A0A5E4NJR9_9HEMI|nr:Hypothetical protein CINCED_3A001428 [Cinara cedri]
MSSTDARRDCCYEHCDDRLCVRNASMCVAGGDADVGPSDRGGGGAVYGDQRPVCLEDVPLSDDDFECFDFDDADSGGTRTTARTAVGLLAVAAVSWCLARTALSAAAVT